MTKKRNEWGAATKLTHPPRPEIHQKNTPVVAPIYQTAKFVVSNEVPLSSQFIYSRVANPTLRSLEESISEILNFDETIVFSSGMAAISTTFLGLLKAGDHLISFRELYRPARIFIKDVLSGFNIEHDLLKLNELDSLPQRIRPNTKIIYFESPSNPNLQIADISKIIKQAKAHGILVIMDATFAGLQLNSGMGVDLIIHSLTKYASGHGDVLAGSVSGSKKLISQIRPMNIALGGSLDPHAASLVSRGLKTYQLRFEKQSSSALEIAKYLEIHPFVTKVYYPGLKNHPQYELASNQLIHSGGILSFEIKTDVGTALEFSHRLELLQFTVSVGSVESLICPTELFFGEDLSVNDRREMGINPQSLRLSVGLESVSDILADLEKAFLK